MYTVLLDSSDCNLAVGLAKNHQLIDFIQYEAWQRQSELMIVELEKILKRNNVTREEIGSVMCGIGPGSYTGVRISLTIAKVMALALNISLYLVSSLQILKDGKNPSICIINARSNRSYVGVYENDKVILSDTIMKNDELKQYIEAHKDYVICGNANHLGVQGKESNVLSEMISLIDYISPTKNSLGATPVYMKD